MLYALLALGLTLFVSVMNIVFFAHGAMYMIAAFGIYYLAVKFSLNYFLAAGITFIGLTILAIVIERGLFRPVLGDIMRVFFLAIGLNWLLESSGYAIFGLRAKGVPTVFPGTVEIFGAVLPWQRLVVILVSLIAVAGLHLFLTRTRLGLGMRCYVEDVDAAALQGIRGNTISRLTFILGVGLAALAGILLAPLFEIQPAMGGHVVFVAFLIIGLGGLGSIPGALLAAIILGFLESFGCTLIGPQLTWGLIFLFVVIFLIIRPKGLMGVVR